MWKRERKARVKGGYNGTIDRNGEELSEMVQWLYLAKRRGEALGNGVEEIGKGRTC